MNMEEIVALSVKHNVSDLHLCSAWPARWRIRGRMEAAPFDAPDVEELLREWLDDDQRAILLENGQLDFAVSLAENQRLRGSAFAQRQGISLALRLLPSHCPQLEQLGAPPVLPELLKSENGLILVTGATGSGKSTTLAAMVGYLNQHADAHILTLEDPVEYLYTSQRCLIQQREIGLHCMTFASGLRAALREDPDVILLGELRDSETIRLALTAAETGHLVLATLHTRGAAQAVERLVDSFPAQEKDPVRNQLAGRLALTAAETGHLVLATLHTRGAAQAVERLVDSFPAQEKDPVRNQLAGSLRAVLSQKLEVDKQEGRVALFELLINTPAVGNLIREGKTHQLPHVIQTGQQVGMITFQQSYQQRVALFELLINTPAVGNLIREGKTHQLPHVIQTGQQVGMITFQQSYQQRVKEGRL